MAVWSEVDYYALTDDRRIDAEFYRPECLSQDEAIKSVSHKSLGDIAYISDGNHISIADQFCEEGIRYLRGKDLSSFFVSDNDPIYIPESTYKALQRSHILEGDILLGIVATIGTVGLVTDRFGKLTGNCKLAIVRPTEIESGYLGAFFLSDLGQRELHRRARGTVQQGVILPDLKEISVPILQKATRRLISKKVEQAYAAKKKSEDKYTEAEALLESALGLEKLDLSQKLFYERPFSKAETAGRIDAEFFSPRMQNLISALSRDSLTIEDVAKISKRRFHPTKGKDFNYIEIGDVSGNGAAGCSVVAGEEAPSRATWVVNPKDVITTTVRPIRGLTAVIDETQDGYVCSSGFAVLTPSKIEPELLLTFLRLPLVRELLDLFTTASMYPAISVENLMQFPIALPSPKDQRIITQKVRGSFSARQESQKLLEEAKRMVEEEILGSAK